MKTTSQINVHELVNKHKGRDGLVYVLMLDNDCLACSLLTMHSMAHKLINTGGWRVDADVGDYICSYDDFRQLYPEYFIWVFTWILYIMYMNVFRTADILKD